MALYRYSMVTADGETRNGTMEADDLAEAISQLVLDGDKLVSIEEIDEFVTTRDAVVATPAFPRSLLTQLQVLLDHREALLPALEAYLTEIPPRSERREVQKVINRLRNAQSPIDLVAGADIDEMPSPIWARMACAAARSPSGANVLRTIVEHFEPRDATWQRLNRILRYPTIVLLAGVMVFLLFSFQVAPEFGDIFELFGTELPVATRIVMGSARFVRTIDPRWYVLALVLATAAYWLSGRAHLRWKQTRMFDLFSFNATLADGIDGNLALADAVEIAQYSTESSDLRQAAANLARQVAEKPAPYRVAGIPKSVQFAIGDPVPEQARGALLRALNMGIRDGVNQRTRWIALVLEPVAIGVVAIFIGFLVVALMLPLISLFRSF